MLSSEPGEDLSLSHVSRSLILLFLIDWRGDSFTPGSSMLTGHKVEELMSDVEGVLAGGTGAENNMAADWMATNDDDGHGNGIPGILQFDG